VASLHRYIASFGLFAIVVHTAPTNL